MSEKNALWRGLLSAESPTGNALKPLWDPSPALPVSSPFGSFVPAPPMGGLFGLGESVGRSALPVTPYIAPAPAIPVIPIERMTYFAFDFDDIMRVNNVRQSGKIGPRVSGSARGFKDRSVWEKSNAKTKTLSTLSETSMR